MSPYIDQQKTPGRVFLSLALVSAYIGAQFQTAKYVSPETEKSAGPSVRYWHKADILDFTKKVRCSAKSRLLQIQREW